MCIFFCNCCIGVLYCALVVVFDLIGFCTSQLIGWEDRPKVTYNVSSRMLNPAVLYYTANLWSYIYTIYTVSQKTSKLLMSNFLRI